MTIFKKGFKYKGFKFGIKNKKLYRLSIIKDGREYSMREVPVIHITANIRGYRVVRDKKSLQQIARMAKDVQYKVDDECKECLK
jgi:hypothetical protein